ncbi:hypothetical protein QRD40_24010 [Comamonas sp. Y6]|uniref:DUF4263 domain-containing protein n=1 Tax=Comamonas resistens TaxID=3046670 RepID=A0ABY8SXP9_9BURK|nr:hypothetical protein [Comamonas resistens]MDL5039399.1 hypothetical protein [Comamonas resistens]WHS67441.1 hypothetical protein QMY55_10165 [Comamonas resistens]
MLDTSATPSGIRQCASLPPYESDLVCDFFRQIGRLEVELHYKNEVTELKEDLLNKIFSTVLSQEQRNMAYQQLKKLMSSQETNKPKPLAGLVGNSQNPLDHLVGDVLGRTSMGRYFIIEFKRQAIGFLEEVDLQIGKPDRAALLCHLQFDDDCQTLSSKGHFGAHWTPIGLHLQSYFTLITSAEESFSGVQDFFRNVICASDFGWSADELQQYIECMTAHGSQIETDSGNLVFGYFTPEAKFILMTGSATIFAMIQEAFRRGDAYRNQKNVSNLSTTGKSSARP